MRPEDVYGGCCGRALVTDYYAIESCVTLSRFYLNSGILFRVKNADSLDYWK